MDNRTGVGGSGDRTGGGTVRSTSTATRGVEVPVSIRPFSSCREDTGTPLPFAETGKFGTGTVSGHYIGVGTVDWRDSESMV